MADFFSNNQFPASDSDIRTPDTVVSRADPFNLDISDEQLAKIMDDRKNDWDRFLTSHDYKERRRINKEYLFGKQLPKGLKKYSARYVDNLIYEAERTIKPIALSRLPDLMAKPGNESEESKKTAEIITEVINSDLRSRQNRKVLGLAFRHHPVYFIGIVKALWNPEKGDKGDYEFRTIHPENLVLDDSCTTNDPQDMEYVAEAYEISIKEAMMRFPKKADELIQEVKLKRFGGKEGDLKESQLASKIKIWEAWFTWYESREDPDTGEQRYERLEGTAWKYGSLVLDKMKNPYWDWEGKKRLIKYDLKVKREPTEDELRKMLFGEDLGFQTENEFNNYFKNPRKPYMLMTYDEWGEHPLDETSRIEQVLLMQDNVNKRGRQITEMNDRSRGKHVFSTDSGLTKTDIKEMDMADPDQDILLDGSTRDVHTYIPGQSADGALYKEQEMERQKVFSKMGTNSTTRGERESQETATGRQILREADFGRIDDLVEETINDISEQMAQWSMQFIKLFYTAEHMKRIVGRDGGVSFLKISRDSIEDGMEVVVSASGTDKLEAKKEAFERARMQLTDPLTFFIDTEASDPRGRAERLLKFILSPELYFMQEVMEQDTQQMGENLQQQPVAGGQPAAGGQPQPQPQPAQPPPPPQGGGSPTVNTKNMVQAPSSDRFGIHLSRYGGGGRDGYL